MRDNQRTAIMMFMLSPMMALFFAIKEYRLPISKNILWAFIAFYGYNFTFTGNYDSLRYREKLIEMHRSEIQLYTVISTVYTGESSRIDFIEPVVTFLVSRFTDNPQILFLIFGILFGYFYSRNLYIIISHTPNKLSKVSIFILFCGAMVVSMNEIAVFRWMFASQIFLYGVLHLFLLNRTSKAWVYIVSAVLIHFSFALAVLTILIYFLIRRRQVAIYLFYVASVFLPEIEFSNLTSITELLPGLASTRYSDYLAEDYAERRYGKTMKSEVSWHAKYHNDAVNIALFCLITIGVVYGRKGIDPYTTVFYFGIFFMAVFNILDSIPSVHRFTYFSRSLIFYPMFMLLNMGYFKNLVVNKYIMVLSPLLFFYAIVRFRLWFEFMGLMSLIGNPLIALFYDDNMPVIDFIKEIFS